MTIRVCWKMTPPVYTCRPSFAVLAVLLSDKRPPPNLNYELSAKPVSERNGEEALGGKTDIISQQTKITPILDPPMPKSLVRPKKNCTMRPSSM